jgi:DNA-directed RNA polymerase sigma subunit (sigma70/sigma32)
MYLLCEEDKDQIRALRSSMTCEQIGQRFGVTRQRVSQVCKEQPNEAKRALERSFRIHGRYPSVSKVV